MLLLFLFSLTSQHEQLVKQLKVFHQNQEKNVIAHSLTAAEVFFNGFLCVLMRLVS